MSGLTNPTDPEQLIFGRPLTEEERIAFQMASATANQFQQSVIEQVAFNRAIDLQQEAIQAELVYLDQTESSTARGQAWNQMKRMVADAQRQAIDEFMNGGK